jgi:radical SAM protein with 4Fe4S-binding SPASM domain
MKSGRIPSLQQALVKNSVALVAKYYLKKPDLTELIALKFPTFGSMVVAAMNELCFLLGLDRGFRLTSVNFEATNHCNLCCKMCPVNHGMEREKTFLEFELFKHIIDENPQLEFILPFQWGEPLLHKQIFDMIVYARHKGIRTMMTTNGTLLNPAVNREILEAGLNRLTFSVDGFGDTHTAIRGYSYEKLKEKIVEFKAMRDQLQAKTQIDISMVVFEDSEADVERYFQEWEGIADRVQLIPRFVSGTRKNKCRELWRGTLVVLSNGLVTTCCADYEGKMVVGDAHKERLRDIWNGRNMRKLRRQHVRKHFPRICRTCAEYESGVVSKRFG